MPFRVVYYHIIWATKYRDALITPQIEPVIFSAIRQKSRKLDSHIHAINGMSDHIHIAVSISTSISVASWVKSVKGSSSYAANNTFPDLTEKFAWQNGYGVLTFGAKALSNVVDYIDKQKSHHEEETLIDYLEKLSDE